jgi:hypothetical protein
MASETGRSGRWSCADPGGIRRGLGVIGILAVLAGAAIATNAGAADTPRGHNKFIGIIVWMAVLDVALGAVGVARLRPADPRADSSVECGLEYSAIAA